MVTKYCPPFVGPADADTWGALDDAEQTAAVRGADWLRNEQPEVELTWRPYWPHSSRPVVERLFDY